MAYTDILYYRHEYILKVENGRNIIKPEAEKDVKNLIVELIFEDRSKWRELLNSINKEDAEEAMRIFFDPNEVNPNSVHIYNEFTWADLIKLFDTKESITKEEFEQILEDYS